MEAKAPGRPGPRTPGALYDTDAANAESLHLNLFQLGIEWARIVPRMPADPSAPLTDADIDHGRSPITTTSSTRLNATTSSPWSPSPIRAPALDPGRLDQPRHRPMARYGEFLAREFGGQVKL